MKKIIANTTKESQDRTPWGMRDRLIPKENLIPEKTPRTDTGNINPELEPILRELEQKGSIHLEIPFLPFSYHYSISRRKADGNLNGGWSTYGGTYGENTPYRIRAAETAQKALSGLLEYIFEKMKRSIDSQQKKLAFNKDALMKLKANPSAFKE